MVFILLPSNVKIILRGIWFTCGLVKDGWTLIFFTVETDAKGFVWILSLRLCQGRIQLI